MQKSFFGRHALLVLIIVYFSIPFALRGSRYAVQRMKNDVKDWLPTNFHETHELEWFREHFLGEQFVVISWDGCHGDREDPRFKAYVDNLFPELPPSLRNAQPEQEDAGYWYRDLYSRNYVPESASLEGDFIGNQLSLKYLPDDHFDWAGKREKWLRSGKNNWLYITPKGKLYQWKGNQTWPAQLWRGIVRVATGTNSVDDEAQLITQLGPIDGPWYYEDPSRLNARLIKSITSGPSVICQLTNEESKLNIGMAEAHDRLRGVLFGPDDKQTCIVVTLTDEAKSDPRALVGRGMLGRERGFLLDVAEKSGVQAPRPPSALPGFLAAAEDVQDEAEGPLLRLGGPPVDNAAIDEEGQITLVRLLGLSLAVGLGLSWICFRSINITIVVFLVGGFSAVTSVGIIYWTGSQLDAVLMSMPSLVYVLGISGAVHVVNYYRESVSETGMATAPDKAVKLGFWPCTMAAFTTSLGLLSLATSNIVPIRKFGCYAAVGVIATLILLFTYLPAALEMWPPRRYLQRTSGREDQGAPSTAIERALDSFWQAVGRFVVGRYAIVQVLSLALLLGGAYGLTKINTSVQLLKLFDGDSKIIEDYEWLEANLGKLVPMELVVCVESPVIDPSTINVDLEKAVTSTDDSTEPPAAGLSFLERMEISKRIAAELNGLYGADGIGAMSLPMSANTFARAAEGGVFKNRMRKGLSDGLEASRQEFIDADFLRDDPQTGAEYWRISLRLAALDDIDFGDFVQQVQRVVEPILLAYEYREAILQQVSIDDPDQRPTFYFVATEQTFGERLTPEQLQQFEHVDEVPIDQAGIFSRHLYRLLQAEGITPSKSLLLNTPEQLQEVKSSDVVVMLDDVEGVTKKELDPLLPLWYDASESYQFDPRSEASETANLSGQNVSVKYTGLVPIVYKAQTTLLTSLIESTGLAFLMIAVVMMLLLRSYKAGMLAMLPNVFPVVVIFGAMGWLHKMVDIGSMMTASVAMGVAVDDTIHFLSWFRRGLDEGRSRKEAILLAYRRVATAMTQTTAIGGIGLSIFAFSTFTPTQMFGTLMLALLAAALIGDLFFLPALLASPLGNMFDRRSATPISDASQNPVNRNGIDNGHPNGKGIRPSSSPSTRHRDEV